MQKGNIFWWFKSRRKAKGYIPQNNIKKEKKEIIITTSCDDIETKKEKKETITTPIPEIIIEEKTKERVLPKKKNERNALLKPSKKTGIEDVIETKDFEIAVENKKQPKDEAKQKNKLVSDIEIKTDTLDEIEKMLLTNHYEIEKIKNDLEILEQKEKDDITKDEVEKLIEELNILIKKFEEIKKDFYRNNFEELYTHTSNDKYIGYLIDEYRTSILNNDTKESTILQINQIKEYITLINCIIEIESKKDELDKKLNDKKETLEVNEIEFDKYKDKVYDTEKVQNYIESFSNTYDRIINDIQEKVARSTTITKKAEYKTELYVNYTKLLAASLLLASTPVIPFTKKGNLLKTGILITAASCMASSIRTKTYENKTITKISFIDYHNEITKGINSISSMDGFINNAIEDIRFLREEFKNEFEEYKNSFEEYAELLSKLDSIEKDLLVKQSINNEYNQKLENALEENNVKIKRLEEETFN